MQAMKTMQGGDRPKEQWQREGGSEGEWVGDVLGGVPRLTRGRDWGREGAGRR